MATFSDIPMEILHFIAQYLAPTSCSDSKRDISTFRLLERGTWLVGNRYAFKYMTLHVRNFNDLEMETKLGKFCRLTGLDPSGFDLRGSVREVCYMGWHPEIKFYPIHPDMGRIKRTFMRAMEKPFDEALSSDQLVAFEHYQKLFVKPYVGCAELAVEIDQLLATRIWHDLIHFPNICTMEVDVHSHFLDPYDESYRYLEDIKVLERFWKGGRFMSNVYDDGEFGNPRLITYETSRWTVALGFLRSIPWSVTKIIWPDRVQLNNHVISEIAPMAEHITELEITLKPDRVPSAALEAQSLRIFSNTRTLRLTSNLYTDDRVYRKLWSERSTDFLLFLTFFVGYISLPNLQSLHIKAYHIGLRELSSLLMFGADYNWELHLDDMKLVRRRADTFDEYMANTSWLHVLRITRPKILDYASRGCVHFGGEFKCITLRDGETTSLWEQEIGEETVKMLEEYLRTGLVAEELVAELTEGASRGHRVEYEGFNVGIGPEREYWRDG